MADLRRGSRAHAAGPAYVHARADDPLARGVFKRDAAPYLGCS